MKKTTLSKVLNILLVAVLIVLMIYCYFNYKNAELRFGIKGINEKEGKIETKIEYEGIPKIYYNENDYYFKVLKDDKYGFINEVGKQIMECKYDYIGEFNEYGLAEVELDDKCGFINKDGKQIMECKYDYIGEFNEYGLAEVGLDDKYGFINRMGEQVLKCEYDFWYIDEPNEYEVIVREGKAGLIDMKEGKIVLDCEYDEITQCTETEFLLEKNDTYYFYKVRKKYLEKMSEEWKYDLENKFAILKSDENYIAINLEKYEDYEETKSVEFNKNGRAWLNQSEKCVCINTKGEILKEFEYNYVKLINDGEYIIVADKNKKYGIIDSETLEFVVKCKYDEVELANDGEYIEVLDENGKYGIIDSETLKFIIECKYDYIYGWEMSLFKEYLIGVKDKTNYVLDKKGNLVKKYNCDDIVQNPFNEKYYITFIDDDKSLGFEKMGLIDENLNEILECKYDIVYVIKNVIFVEDNGKRTLFDWNLNKIMSLDEYDGIDPLYSYENEYIKLFKDNKVVLLDLKKNEVLDKYIDIFHKENIVVVGRKKISLSFIVAIIFEIIILVTLVFKNVRVNKKITKE